MSNKPKGVKRLTKYELTKGERRHTSMVNVAKSAGLKHSGSKPMCILHNIIPTKATIYSKFKDLFGNNDNL